MNRLKFLREEKGLYQSDIAKILNVSITAITYYENEKRDISTENLKKLSDFFDVSIDYLLGKSDIRNPEPSKIDENKVMIALSSQFNKLSEESQKKVKEQIELLLENEELKRKLKDK